MARTSRASAALFIAAALCLSPLARGDEKGEALVREAAERFTALIPFYISFSIVITKDGVPYEISGTCLSSGSHSVGGRGEFTGAGAPGDLNSIITILRPFPPFSGQLVDPVPPVLSSRYAGQETVSGITYETVEVTQDVIATIFERARAKIPGHSFTSNPEKTPTLARARLKWFLDAHRFLRRVTLVKLEPATDASGNSIPLSTAFQGVIKAETVVTELRRPRIVAPRSEIPGIQHTIPEPDNLGQGVVSGRSNLEISPDGSLIARLTGPGTVDVVEAATGKPHFRLQLDHERHGVTFSPDSRMLITTSGARIRMYETLHGTLARSLDEARAPLLRPSISTDGFHVAAGGEDGIVRIWNVRTGRLEHEIDHPALTVAFSPDGKRLATFGRGSNIQLWDTEKWEILRRLDMHVETGALRLAFSPDGKWIAAGSESPEIRLFDGSTERPQRTFPGVGPVSRLVFSSDSASLISLDRDERSDDRKWTAGLTIWDIATGNMRSTFSLPLSRPSWFVDSQVTPDGKRLVFQDGPGRLVVVERKAE